MLGSAGMTWQGSNAAFTASTVNTADSWSAGSVILTDDDTGTTMFTVTQIKPGDTGTKCINVDYAGTFAADVRLYRSQMTDGTPGLATYLDMTVDIGTGATGGATASCTSFAVGTAGIYSGTLNAMPTTFGTGITSAAGAWSPTAQAAGAHQIKSYRITWSLASNVSNSANGGSVTGVEFTWEAQNT